MLKKMLEMVKNRRLIVTLVLLFFAVNIFMVYLTFSEKTTSSIWDGTIAKKFDKGTGKAGDPYIIETGSELAYLFTLINSDKSNDYFNKFYEIRNNIDLNGYDFSFLKPNKIFSGTIEGNGYTIFNFTLNKYSLNDEKTTATFGLFDSLYSADIKNINFKDITIKFNADDVVNIPEVKVEETKTTTDETEKTESEEQAAIVRNSKFRNLFVTEGSDGNDVDPMIPTDTTGNENGNTNGENTGDTNGDTTGDGGDNTNPSGDNEGSTTGEAGDNTSGGNNDGTTTGDGEGNEPGNNGTTNDDNTGNNGGDNTGNEPGNNTEPTNNDVVDPATPTDDTEPGDDEVPDDTEITDDTNTEPEYDPDAPTDLPDFSEVPVPNTDTKVDNSLNTIEEIDVGLFNRVERSNIKNISINNITIEVDGVQDRVIASLFVVYDINDNTFENLVINGVSNVETTYTLVKDYNNATINNVVYRKNGLTLISGYDGDDDTFYMYTFNDKKLEFTHKYPVKSVLGVLNNNSELTWRLQDNLFNIINNGVDAGRRKSLMKMNRAAPSAHASGLDGTTVYINDYATDANYYQGLNYTYSSNGRTPTTANKNLYNDSNLVYVEAHYYGRNYTNNYTGTVSTTESANQFVYYKVYPVNDNGTTNNNTDDYIEIELIDNPYARRPNDKVFMGWSTDYSGVDVSLDTDIYVRYAKVPVTYNGTDPANITINFYSIWGTGVIVNHTGTWSTSFSPLESKGFHSISEIEYGTNIDLTQLYLRRTTARYTYYPNPAYNQNGASVAGNYCTTRGGCTYYIHAGAVYDPDETYYELNGQMRVYTVPLTPIGFITDVPVGDSIAGYFRQVIIPRNATLVGYYNSSGDYVTSGTCTTNGGCSNYYELIQFYDSNNDPEVVVSGNDYFYLTTRDTNIIVLNRTVTNIWSSSENKPFTLTGIAADGSPLTDSYYLGVNGNGRNITCYADTRIEHIRTYSNTTIQSDDTSASGNAYITGNSKNLKIGRNVTPTATNRVTWKYVFGSSNSAEGSSSNYIRYRLIVESGIYNVAATVGSSSASGNHYVDATGIWGNDYDRVTEADPENDAKLRVAYCLAGTWNGTIRGVSATTPNIHTIIKSGRFGTNKYDIFAGIYLGACENGTTYSMKEGIFEGGWTYSIIGAPLTNSGNSDYNDTVIYIKGGYLDNVIGGAGRSTTYGNRIIQMTGGQVNYSVFGGSNGATSSNGQGALEGDTYVYIGGNAVVGDPTLVANNTNEPMAANEAGSVFGIGNGRSGYASIGTADNSYVVIDGDCTINRNVYGGGNYGATGQNGSNQTYASEICIVGGNVKGSVYGGGNNNGAGTTNNTVNVTIKMSGGTVDGSVYGGSRTEGKINGGSTLNITGGTIKTDVYGGGEGGIAGTGTTGGTFVRDNINITVGDSNGGPTINGNVYGGSAYGTVNQTTVSNTHNTKQVNVTVNNGSVLGSVFGGAKGSATYTPHINGNITVNINGGTIGSVYGGFDAAGKPLGTDIVNITGGTIVSVYGGGKQTSVDNTDINMTGGSVNTMYGGSNQSGAVLTTDIDITGGSIGTLYGGNNQGGTCGTSNININGGSVTTAVYGGGNLVGITTTNVDIVETTNTIPVIYGGGNQAGATTTNVEIKGSASNTAKATTVYGGSNQSGTVTNSYVKLTQGSVGTIYGGNNSGGTTTTTHVTIDNGGVTTIYGGGYNAVSGSTNVTVNNVIGTITDIYGGGNQAVVSGDTHITLNRGTITNVYGGGNEAGCSNSYISVASSAVNVGTMYGGSNQLGTVSASHITMTNGIVGTMYGGNNAGGTTNATSIVVNNGSVTNVYGGGNQAGSGTTSVTINNVSGTVTGVYGGGNQAGATSSTVVVGPTTGNNINVTSIYGGSNQSGTVGTSNVTVNNVTSTDVYGGNNLGGTTTAANVTVNGSTITNLYGGGNQAVTGSTNVDVNTGSITTLYGGGNAANVTGGTDLDVIGAAIPNNLYGGGNQGAVGGDTNVLIHNSTIGGSAYAGGNGSTAIVYGDTSITVSGTTVVGTSSCTLLSSCSVFGGGNAAETGSQAVDDSIATVNIIGATIYGNVYGGANTSKVFGETVVNIGDDVATGTNIVKGDIDIHGTVFGGGETNASGGDEYDWSFISVSKGIDININGNGYNNFNIDGSIFGSGNASTSGGTSTIMIKNYGTFANPEQNISIQRTDSVTLDNSNMQLFGATDRENEYSDVLFTLSRIDSLTLRNNSTLFLETGANLLQEFNSLNSNGTKATVTIDTVNGTVTKSTDNRVYMFADKKLNIAKDQNVSDYGEVNGMAFFGMYKHTGGGSINLGMYDDFDYDEVLDWAGVFDNVSSYVLGLHETNHDIHVDGFYTNYIEELTAKNKIDYITPTPPASTLYMWTIGEGVIEYEIDLSASKYSTLGTYELSLIDFTQPNTSFDVLGFDYSELEAGVSLIDKNQVPKIAANATDADNVMGLAIETSNIGWLTNGQTSFYTTGTPPYSGTNTYVGGNNASAPTLLVYLYHAKNLATAGSMGTARIQLLSIRQINALEKETKRLNISVNLSRVLYDTINYEGAMTAGRKYELFTSTATNITDKSSLSAYYSLFNSGVSIYKPGYHRTLVSTFVLPLNTKITMIDLSGSVKTYYYHTITAADVAAKTTEIQTIGEASYNLSMFEVMGAENSGVYYDDVQKNIDYNHTSPDYDEEEFIFILDFGDTNITANQLNNKLLLEMRNAGNQTIYSVLAPQHDSLTYNIYDNKDAVIDMQGTISANKIYNGESFTADLQIDYTQSMVGSTVIYDTHYFDSKLGIKISLLNSDDDVVTGTTLLGLNYVIDEIRYDPNIDGTTRIKIADKVDSAEKWVIINTGTSTISSGNYTLRFESFGSPDGIFYGLQSSDTLDFAIEIVNEIYGLDVDAPPEEIIIDDATGLNEAGTHETTYTILYNSGLANPNIRLKMYRRNYTNASDTTYSLVDAGDIFDDLESSGNTYEYMIEDDPTEEFTHTLTYGSGFITGTYKMQFILYDDDAVIGSVDKYIIIR